LTHSYFGQLSESNFFAKDGFPKMPFPNEWKGKKWPLYSWVYKERPRWCISRCSIAQDISGIMDMESGNKAG
jgi:hypothetical protein